LKKFFETKIDGLVKSSKSLFSVIPAKAGIQFLNALRKRLDSGFHRSDDLLRALQDLVAVFPALPYVDHLAGKGLQFTGKNFLTRHFHFNIVKFLFWRGFFFSPIGRLGSSFIAQSLCISTKQASFRASFRARASCNRGHV
jgi:hypothetical protein